MNLHNQSFKIKITYCLDSGAVFNYLNKPQKLLKIVFKKQG